MRFILITILLFSTILSFSQNKPTIDLASSVNLFNGKTIHSTGRSLALGGVESPLGASIYSAVVNPAGFGVYRRSAFNVTIGYNVVKIKSTAMGLGLPMASESEVTKTSINSLGAVFLNDVEDGIVKNSAFAVTYNKLKDYNYEFEYKGRVASGGKRNSYLETVGNSVQGDYWTSNVIDFNAGELITNDEGILAYWGYVVKPVDETDLNATLYYIDHSTEPSVISEQVISTGSKSSWDFSYGANLDDKLFLGLGLGLGIISNRVEKSYSESLETYPGDGLIGFSTRQISTNRGYGLNLKLGTIYRVNDNVRLSYAFHTGTKYRMTEEYQASIETVFDSLGDTWLATVKTANVNTRYSYKEPWKMNFGGAYFFSNKKGFVALEVNFQSYKKTKLVGGAFDWTEENQEIKNRYKNAVNYKLGCEYRKGLGRYRFGISVFGDPDKDAKFSRFMIGGGAGVKWKQFYMDFGLAYENHQFEYAPYELLDNSEPKLDNILTQMHYNITIGFSIEKEE